MNPMTWPEPAAPLRLRLAHASATTLALVTTFLAFLRTIASGRGDSLDIAIYASITLFFSHLAWHLGPKAYARRDQRNLSMIIFALFVGYLCLGLAISLEFGH